MNRKNGTVCLLSSVHPWDDSRIFHKEAKSLVDFGYQVSFVVQHSGEMEQEGVRIIPLRTPTTRLQRMLHTTWQTGKEAMKQNADIYHFHDPELIPIGLWLRLRGKKVIYDVHEDVPRQILSKAWIPKPVRSTIARIVERLEHFAAKRFHAVVTATAHIGERFEPYCSHTVTICNFPLLSEFPEAEWNPEQKELAVCYVGGISRIRGIREMVEAVGMTEAKLLLAGLFPEGSLRDEVMALQGWSQVEELGYVGREEIRRTLSRSMVGIYVGHPIINYVHSLPIKLFEYMAAGIPVIVSNFPGLKEIVEGKRCGICVDPLDPQAIAQAIRWFMDHPEEAREMGANGRRAIEESYHWGTQSKQLKSLYEVLSAPEHKMQSQIQKVKVMK